jgi:hypothetical protein
MPRDRKTPHEQKQLDAANRRAEWLSAFNAELIRLRPHLEGASKWLNTVGVTELAREGLDADPKAVARAYHEAQKK